VSRRKPPTFGDLAAGAAHGRRVVASVGQLDGAFLAALAKVQLASTTDGTPVSTWGEGVTDAPPAANELTKVPYSKPTEEQRRGTSDT